MDILSDPVSTSRSLCPLTSCVGLEQPDKDNTLNYLLTGSS